MKRPIKLILGATLALSSPAALCAQGTADAWEIPKPKTDYQVKKSSTSIGFISTNMKQEGMPELKSNFGFSLTKSKSYFIGRPMAGGRLRLGIDVAFTDLAYTNYKIHYNYPVDYGDYGDENTTIHEIEGGIQAGLGVNFAVTRLLNFHLTARYNPCFSGLYDGDNFSGAFGNFGIVGLTANYGMIGLGIEYRFGQAKYKSYLDLSDFDEEDGDMPGQPMFSHDKKFKTTFSGLRALLVFHF